MNMEWQPIETAPKDGTKMLVYRPSANPGATVTISFYKEDGNAKKPRPYWAITMSTWNVVEQRLWEPTHWMPLPKPPTQDSE